MFRIEGKPNTNAQDAVRRLAKEGRKYGIGLLLISQRPSEVEVTVLSQCNTWIVMRISNESDRNYVQGILPDFLGGLTKVLSGLRRREAIFVGQAASYPLGLLSVTWLGKEQPLPRSQDIDFDKGWQSDSRIWIRFRGDKTMASTKKELTISRS